MYPRHTCVAQCGKYNVIVVILYVKWSLTRYANDTYTYRSMISLNSNQFSNIKSEENNLKTLGTKCSFTLASVKVRNQVWSLTETIKQICIGNNPITTSFIDN